MKKLNLRPYLSGLLPLFIFAHFGHHVVMAMLRPLMPMIRTGFGLSYTQSGWVMSAFSISYGISQLPAGWLADRFGPRLMVLISVAGVALAGFLIGFSNSFVTLIILLVLAALLGGGYHPAAGAAIASSIPAEHRGRAFGLHQVGGGAAFWIVPLIAAPIAVAWGWRSSYALLSIPIFLLGILLYILIGRWGQTPIRETPDTGVDTPVESTRIPWRKLAPFIILSVAIGTMIQSVSAYFSLYAVDNLGASESVAAMLMSISPAVGFVAAPVGGYLSDRFGSITVLLVVSFLAGPLVYLFGLAPNVTILAALMVAIGIVSTTRMPTSESYISGNSPPHRRATLLGLYFFAGQESPGLLTPVIGNLIDRVGFQSTFTIAAAVTGAAMVVCTLFLWRNRT
ncbi:MFS transporter [Chloroflexota bacterium]